MTTSRRQRFHAWLNQYGAVVAFVVLAVGVALAIGAVVDNLRAHQQLQRDNAERICTAEWHAWDRDALIIQAVPAGTIRTQLHAVLVTTEPDCARPFPPPPKLKGEAHGQPLGPRAGNGARASASGNSASGGVRTSAVGRSDGGAGGSSGARAGSSHTVASNAEPAGSGTAAGSRTPTRGTTGGTAGAVCAVKRDTAPGRSRSGFGGRPIDNRRRAPCANQPRRRHNPHASLCGVPCRTIARNAAAPPSAFLGRSKRRRGDFFWGRVHRNRGRRARGSPRAHLRRFPTL
jgi:hypothetical protein